MGAAVHDDGMFRQKMRKLDDPNMSLNRIVGATAENLIVEIDGKRRLLAWTSVQSVYASIATRDDNMPIMAFEIQDRGSRRTMLVGQVDAVWTELKAVLHIGLPEAVPVDVWERALIEFPMVLPIFRRNKVH